MVKLFHEDYGSSWQVIFINNGVCFIPTFCKTYGGNNGLRQEIENTLFTVINTTGMEKIMATVVKDTFLYEHRVGPPFACHAARELLGKDLDNLNNL